MDVGDLVPDFELSDETGTTRSLSGLLADGPVTLFFYRGHDLRLHQGELPLP